MPELRHDFEGTPDATSVTTGSGGNSNTAGNNYFDLAPRDTGGSPVGVNEYASDIVSSGTRALKIRTGSAATATYVGWNATSRAAVQDDFGSFDYYVDAFPTVNMSLARWYSGALAHLGGITQLATGKLGIVSASFVSLTLSNGLGASNLTLSTGTWYRIEFWHHAENAANGRLTVRVYTTAGLILDEFTSQAVDATMAAATSARFDLGNPGGNANQPTTTTTNFIRLDNIRDTATAWPTAAPSLNTVLTSTLRS